MLIVQVKIMLFVGYNFLTNNILWANILTDISMLLCYKLQV